MSTKYSVGARGKWRHQHDVAMTDHAAYDRWDERTPAWSCSPEHAYEHAIKISDLRMQAFQDRGGQTPDRVRFWAERNGPRRYGVVFIVRDEAIVTIYALDSLPGRLQAFFWAIAEEELL